MNRWVDIFRLIFVLLKNSIVDFVILQFLNLSVLWLFCFISNGDISSFAPRWPRQSKNSSPTLPPLVSWSTLKKHSLRISITSCCLITWPSQWWNPWRRTGLPGTILTVWEPWPWRNSWKSTGDSVIKKMSYLIFFLCKIILIKFDYLTVSKQLFFYLPN